MKRILLDCDPGIDDSVAILLTLKSPELHLEAITTVSGNVTADRAAINARKTLELIGHSNVPVIQGMMSPLVRPYPRDPFSHGDDGLGNTALPPPSLPLDPRFAPTAILETIHAYPGEVTLVATGPLTNIAMAILQDPAITSTVAGLILIGGAYGFNRYATTYATGDNPTSEWNVFVDPEAARIVFRSAMPITAIGLDVATQPAFDLRPEHYATLERASNREAAYMLQLLHFVANRGFRSYCVLIDSAAIAAAIDPSLFRTESIYVDVETRGELTLGQTVVDRRVNFRWDNLPTISAAYDTDFERFHNLVIERITAR